MKSKLQFYFQNSLYKVGCNYILSQIKKKKCWGNKTQHDFLIAPYTLNNFFPYSQQTGGKEGHSHTKSWKNEEGGKWEILTLRTTIISNDKQKKLDAWAIN